jgi:aminoglycoside 6'-N-acetyltransferase
MRDVLFKSLQEKDLLLLYHWFQEPIINQWYARAKHWSLDEIKKKYEPRILGKEDVPSFTVYKNETPIGFIQYYRFENGFPEGIKGEHNVLFQHYDKDELAGVDLFIAEADMRGKGLGARLIQQFTEEFLCQFSAIVVDPKVSNVGALRCYERAGFVRTAFSEDPNYFVMLKTNNPDSI